MVFEVLKFCVCRQFIKVKALKILFDQNIKIYLYYLVGWAANNNIIKVFTHKYVWDVELAMLVIATDYEYQDNF